MKILTIPDVNAYFDVHALPVLYYDGALFGPMGGNSQVQIVWDTSYFISFSIVQFDF